MGLLDHIFRKRDVTASSRVEDIYLGLRNQALSVRPPQISDAAPNGILGFLMDLAMSNGIATIVAIADGTVSLYTSSGGGTLGLGAHPGPRRVAQELLSMAPQFLKLFFPAPSDHPLPAANCVTFWIVNTEGTKTATVSSHEFMKPGHPLFPLFAKTQDLITEMRQVGQL